MSIYVDRNGIKTGPFDFGILVSASGPFQEMHAPGFFEFKNMVSHPGDGTYMDIMSGAAGRFVRLVTDYYKYFETRKVTPRTITSEGASLSMGGLFDIDHNWKPSHCGHRFGREVDVSHRHLRPEERQVLARLLKKSNLVVNVPNERPEDPNSTHWHIAFKD